MDSATPHRPLTGAQVTVRPLAAWSAQNANRVLTEDFSSNADAVILLAPNVSLDPQAQHSLLSAASAVSPCIISALPREPSTAERPSDAARFVGSYYWNSNLLIWLRESGYFRIGPTATIRSEINSHAGSDAVLILKSVWLKVGIFDELFRSDLAYLDWTYRARNLGIPCYQSLAPGAWSTPVDSPEIYRQTGIDEIIDALYFAHKHRAPCSISHLYAKRLLHACLKEHPRAPFWADYGIRVSLFRRFLWYSYRLMPRQTLKELMKESEALFSLITKIIKARSHR